jgi:hypothetical protein
MALSSAACRFAPAERATVLPASAEIVPGRPCPAAFTAWAANESHTTHPSARMVDPEGSQGLGCYPDSTTGFELSRKDLLHKRLEFRRKPKFS